MRNLSIIGQKESKDPFFDPVKCSQVYSVGDELYALKKWHEINAARLFRIKVKDGESGISNNETSQEEFICGDNFECKDMTEEQGVLNGVFQLQIVPTSESIYMATVGGQFLQYCRSYHDSKVHELFKSEQGIARFSVSPDSRLVAIMTRKMTFLLLTLPDLECIAQHVLFSAETVEEINLLEDTVSIVWRYDSRYFAVNFPLNNGSNFWVIKIYDDCGVIYSTTEECNPLLNSCLEWQPSGGLIAAFGKSPHGNVVNLFELNGLKRADFSPYYGRKEEERHNVQGLKWNSASDILAVRLKNSVELWSRNNYVWMRKKVIQLGDSSEGNRSEIRLAEWNTEHPYRIHVVYGNGSYHVYDVAFSYTSGHSCGSALTASWNGRNIYCTPFRDNCAPPPFGFFQASIDSDVIAVLISNFWNGFLCVAASGTFSLFRNDQKTLHLVSTLVSSEFEVPTTSNWIWPNKSTVCSIFERNIFIIKLQEETNTIVKVDSINHEILSKFDSKLLQNATFRRIHCVYHEQKESDLILAETFSICNSVVLVNIQTHEITNICKLPHGCTSLKFIKLEELNNLVVFAHDGVSKKLYVGWSKDPFAEPIKLSTDCTSVGTFGDNLLFTTSVSLEIYNREALVNILEQNTFGKEMDENLLSKGKYTRKIEKGSLIVTCCLNQMLEPSLVLQIIPRGNFETIYPRPLLISSLRVSMRELNNNSRYEKIMTALRRHRVDYRVLMDEIKMLEKDDPTMTLERSLQLMIEQVQDSHSLVLLITDLDDDYIDCISIIKNILEKIILDSDIGKGNRRSINLEESYLASLAKLGLLEEALKSQLIEGEAQENRDVVTHRIKFLSYYCDNPDILFDTAIGTYDLTLASLVADCLGKDPKEYLPVLDGFQSLPQDRRMFKIDEKLRRFSKAITHLINDISVQHDEVLKYMERHRLFSDAIEFIKIVLSRDEITSGRNREDLGMLLTESKADYGKYLEEHGKLKEACILYRGGNCYDKAIDCAVKSGCWEIALEIFFSHITDQTKLLPLYERILEQLEENKNYADAAHVCEMYLKDNTKAVGFYLRHRKWLQAKLVAQRDVNLKETCLEEMIRPKLQEYVLEQIQNIDSLTSDVIQKGTRLKVVKAKKLRRLEGGDDGDNFSDTDSVSTSSSTRSGSTGTGKTYRSGKNKRKLERRLQSMKEGSAYEDLAIIAYLWANLEKIQQEIKPNTSELIEALWVFEMNDLALTIGSALDNLLTKSNNVIQEAWQTVLTDELLEIRYRIPPVGWSISWDKLCLHESSSKAVNR